MTPGETYKLQILFYEGKTNSRRWDIMVEGVMSVDQVSSLGVTTLVDDDFIVDPDYDPTAGVVFTQVITATDDTLDIVFGQIGGNFDGTDLNPIWQGLTLERIVPDTDNDGLPDAWEMAVFGNLDQTASGDADGDGLSNSVEHNLGTNAANKDTDGDGLDDGDEFYVYGTDIKNPDTDGDGLTDGAEAHTHKTDPLAVDTDQDGLPDAAEISTHGTDPLKNDSDGDDYPDGVEIENGTDPLNPTSFPQLSSFVRPITGGDAGEGLDLTGNFKYAFNVGPNGAPGVIRGVNFTDETNDGRGGITISPGQEVGAWESFPDLGPSDDDMNLGALLWSIRHAGVDNGQITVVLEGLTSGKPYKLQLLFMERCCARAFDIYVDGQLKLDDFAPYTYQDVYLNGTVPVRGSAAVIGFLASGPTVEIVLDGSGVTTPAYTDHNPILNGVTLEEINSQDTDNDGLDDLWEIANFGNLNQTGAGDPDQDGLTNLQENTLGTDPNNADTDGDGLTDGAEVNTHQTNPRLTDTDGDGLSDGFEVQTIGSNPLSKDTDGDGYPDAVEVQRGTNASNAASYPLFGVNIGLFTGGDPGAAPGPVGDVHFTSDWENGVFVTASQEAANWMNPSYGDTENDDNLEFVMRSIRWSTAPDTVGVELPGLTPGKAYKLQLLFGEQTSPARGFNIELEGEGVLDDFITAIPLGGVGVTNLGAVVTIGFIARDDTLNLNLNGNDVTDPSITDRNPILFGLTLEELDLPDTDGDGLPDTWEMQYFSDLSQTGAQDSDGDGLVNSAELLAGTNPNNPDSDGDGLSDGAEANAGTNPHYKDTDRDGLPDGLEIELGTNPLLPDTDSDTFLDGFEVLSGSDPLRAGSTPFVHIDAFSGGDPGEGLDLTGSFLYAFNVGTNAVSGQAGDAVFTSDSIPGIWIGAENEIPNWQSPVFGDSPADKVLEGVMSSIRWSAFPNVLTLKLSNLTAGQRYKIQLMFAESGYNRGFDVYLGGILIADDFYPGQIQGETSQQGAVLAYEFIAPDTEVSVVLNGLMAPGPDRNPTLSGVTLETLSAPPVPADFSLTVSARTANGITFSVRGPAGKTFALDYSPSLAPGSWAVVNGNVTIPAGGLTEVTDNTPARLSPGVGFRRLRDPALKPQP